MHSCSYTPITRVLGALFLGAGIAGAQSLVEYDSTADLIGTLCALDNPVTVAGDGVCPAGTAGVPVRVPTPFPMGAVTANHPGRLVLMTNGITDIVRSTHPLAGCPGSGVVYPPLPLPAPYGAGAPITGMTMDPTTQFIFLTDGGAISQHDPATGMALIGGPWPVVGLNFVTGLDFDSCTGNLIAVDDVGGVGELQITGGGLVLVNYQLWGHPALIPAGVFATGVAIDREAAHPCGGGLPAHYVSWTNGAVIHRNGGIVATPGLGPQGLGFAGIPIAMSSPAGAPLGNCVSEFTHELQPFNVRLCGIPAGAAAIALISTSYIPGGIPFPGGETLWVNPATLLPPIAAPVVGTTASVGVPPLPYGMRFFAQWATVSAAGTELSDALQVELSRL